MPRILAKLGFSQAIAAAITPHIQVDPARGSGHCASVGSRKFKVRLRTRVPASGMNYKGYSIALHEMGHAVESVLDLFRIDYFSLAGVPNTAFTEAFAYVFQDRALDILGIEQNNPQARHWQALDSFWNSYEIMGVSLLDMKVWHWLYDHPQATAAELKGAVLATAKEIWNKYFAKVFGVRDQIILAVYSHIIDSTLYLPDYAIGHVIQFQIEEYLRNKTVGPEMERMLAVGNILPQLWMKNAVGTDISPKPLLQAINLALKALK
jgi:oligoendopeptidase F